MKKAECKHEILTVMHSRILGGYYAECLGCYKNGPVVNYPEFAKKAFNEKAKLPDVKEVEGG